MAVSTKATVSIEGNEIAISNPGKLLWPDSGITKLDYLSRLTLLAPYLLHYCKNRYLTTIRYPDGILFKSFYQKNSPEPTPDFFETAELQGIRYVHLNSLSTLLWLGNLACIEFHPSFNGIGHTQPLEWMIDIDPSVEEEPRIMQAAWIVGELLESLHIKSIAKTSGATGVQIYVPVEKRYSFEELRKIGKFLAEYLVEQHPRLFTVERLKEKRGTLIYIDYLQHWHGKTLSAPYTPRARAGAPVSTPLEWEEVKADVHPKQFHLGNIEARLREKGDLIAKLPAQSLDPVLSFIR